MSVRQSPSYLNCMAAKLPYCLQGFCSDGSVCTYQQCWEQADTACAGALVPAQQLPLPPEPVPETSTNLDLIGLVYAAAQAAAGVLPAGANATDINPAAIPPELPTTLAPAIGAALPALAAAGIDPGALLNDLLGFHVAVQQKKLTGDTSQVQWGDVNKALSSPVGTATTTTQEPGAQTTPTKPEEKKSRWPWIAAGAAVVAVGAYFVMRDDGGRRSNPAGRTEGKWAAGVWEQGIGFVPWSYHTDRDRAFVAARSYARRQSKSVRTGGALSWAGGVAKDGKVWWVDGKGVLIESGRV